MTTKRGDPQARLTEREALAAPGTAKAKLYGILAQHRIDPSFSPEVDQEVQAFLRKPGLDDPALDDLTGRPFITIDNEDSRDLDQAMFIERVSPRGFRVFYALADTSHYVRPGSALYAEAMRRGVTLYLPSMAVPMLPSEFSEGLVSLNEGVERRALTMIMTLDGHGKVLDTRLRRTKIRSRGKLTYDGVQQYYDHRSGHALAGQPFTETLDLLAEVGELRIRDAQARDVVRISRMETRHAIRASDPTKFETFCRGRNQVERYNEQISLMCNAEGAKLMQGEGNAPYVTPIFRVHPEPVGRRLDAFRAMVVGAAKAHRADPDVWIWRDGQSLADFLLHLPGSGPLKGLAMAIQRQAVMVNSASEFSTVAGVHHGVGVDPYARFSSPMREMVGVYTHKEALEKLGVAAPQFWPSEDPKENQALVVDLANRTKKLQNQIEKESDRLVLDQYLQDDLQKPFEDRPTWRGTILGLSARKAYIQMKDPPFEVKVYLEDLSERFATKLTIDRDGAVARSSNPAALGSLKMGDDLDLKLDRFDKGKRRYVFTPLAGA